MNLRNVGVLHLNKNDPFSGAAGVPRNMTTIAQVMSRAGYSTHFVGKWDAGMATPRHTPRGRGYDSSLFYFQHANDEWAKSMGSGLTGIATTGALDICLNGDSAATPAGPGVTFRDFSEHNATYAGGVRDPAALSDACADSDDPMPPCFEDASLQRTFAAHRRRPRRRRRAALPRPRDAPRAHAAPGAEVLARTRRHARGARHL